MSEMRKVVSTPKRNRATLTADAKTPLKSRDLKNPIVKLVCVDAHSHIPMEETMRVRIISDRSTANVGDRRFEVEWWVETARAKRVRAEKGDDAVDLMELDECIESEYSVHSTKAKAMQAARYIVGAGMSCQGVALVREQVVEEIGPGCGEWEDVSQEEVG